MACLNITLIPQGFAEATDEVERIGISLWTEIIADRNILMLDSSDPDSQNIEKGNNFIKIKRIICR